MTFLLLFACGWLYVNTIEYFYHRFALHSGHSEVHERHHVAFLAARQENTRILSRWAWPVYGLHAAAFYLVFSPVHATLLAVSVGSYMIMLEFMHAWQHRHPHSSLAHHHIRHHHNPRSNFNVFLPVWDILCGTRQVFPLPQPHRVA